MSDGLRDDHDLIMAARGGDQTAYAELWERHRRPAYVAVRSQTSALDPEDVVSEAFARVLRLMQEGKGPDRSFRPYLYQVVRTVVREELRPSEAELDDEVVDAAVDAYDVESAFDRDTARRAFTQVPEKYRTVLWQLEIEGRTPREAARVLGMTPNHVSALRVRGRKALRKAWIEVQVSSVKRADACDQFAILLVREATDAITRSQAARLQAHLDTCRACRSASDEAHSLAGLIGGRIMPIIIGLGAGVGAAMPWGETAAVAATGVATAATSAATSALAPASTVTAVASSAKTVGIAAFAPKAIAAVFASVAVVGGGVGVWNVLTPDPVPVVQSAIVTPEAVAPEPLPTATVVQPQETTPAPTPTPEIVETPDPVVPEPDPAPTPEPPPVVEPEPTTPAPEPSPTPTLEPMSAPVVVAACAVRVSDSTFSVAGEASGSGTVQVAPVQDDTANFVSADVADHSGSFRWATETLTLTGTGVSFRGVAPDGTVGSWMPVNLQVC